MSGSIALVGGGEWQKGCDFDRDLLAEAGTDEVLVLPTAAAYEQPQAAVDTATAWFGDLGAKVRSLMVLKRHEAEDAEVAAIARAAKFIYIGGGSPLHLRSVLKDSALWQAMCEAWEGGAVLAASSAGAMAVCDPMIDPRGGAYTLGLGLVTQIAVLPHADAWSHDKFRRTLELLPSGTRLVGIEEHTAVIRSPEGAWRAEGPGTVKVWCDGDECDITALP